ncbi:hypothetical protein Trydic_g14383 [Trypoxylus dichotomus]
MIGYRALKSDDIAFKKASKESRSVELGVCDQWTENLPTLSEGKHTDEDIVQDYATTSMGRNDTEDEADQASASLRIEERLFPKKQEAINALEIFNR